MRLRQLTSSLQSIGDFLQTISRGSRTVDEAFRLSARKSIDIAQLWLQKHFQAPHSEPRPTIGRSFQVFGQFVLRIV
jgi:hypothetical protein